jgi:dTMP kinase
MRKSRGVLIVIEGTDGAGKATQHKLLVSALRRANRRVATLDFPQYGKKSAFFVEKYLNGDYGPAQQLSPYIASLFYTLDRYAAKTLLLKWLKQGRVVVANRYTLSNAAHQGGKIKSKKALSRYWQWLFNLEYGTFGLPQADLTIVLHMPAKLAQRLVLKKTSRKYLKRGVKRDAHEADLAHLKSAEVRYLELAKIFGAKVINCVDNGKLLTPQQIHRNVLGIVKDKLK